MTVSYVVVVASRGGTSSGWSIARDRPARGDLRRRVARRERRADHAGCVDGPARSRSVGERDGAALGSGWRVPSGAQGLVVGRDDLGGRFAHRSRRRVAGGRDATRVAVPGDGTIDVGDVPAGVHVRTCPSTRRGDRRDVAARLVAGGPAPAVW